LLLGGATYTVVLSGSYAFPLIRIHR